MADRRVLARSRSLEGPHGPPQPGGHVARLGELQPTTLVPQTNGVYAVLQGLSPDDVLLGGYGYLDWSSAGTAYHEGLDLNSLGGGDADLGALVVAPVAGRVQFVGYWDGRTTGFGNHVAVWLDAECASPKCYLHVAHLHTITCVLGQRVEAGQQLGTCGKSGLQPYAHVHTSLWYDVPPGGNWNFWQTGYSKEWVASKTLDPEQWYWATAARAGELLPPLPDGGIPSMAKLLSDWEITHWILADLYAWAGLGEAFNPESGICKAWVAALRAGHYPGRPRTAERPYGEGDQAGVWQECEGLCLFYRHSDGATSWRG